MPRCTTRTSIIFIIICTFGLFLRDFYENSKFLDHSKEPFRKSIFNRGLKLKSWNLTNSEPAKKKMEATEGKYMLDQIIQSKKSSSKLRVWNENMSSKDLVPRLQQVKRNYLAMNKYKVNFQGKLGQVVTPHELLCKLKNNVNMSTIRRSDLPYNASSWSQYLPLKTLQEEVGTLERCAVVSSAGSIRLSKLGQEIVSRPDLNFLENPQYKEGILLMWDPAYYKADLLQWHRNPDYQFYDRFTEYRKKNPDQMFFILNPQATWQLWDIIQESSPEQIQPDPPSSGLLGILLMMNLCNQVNVYEFLPSKRQTDLCHYYEKYQDRACTLGAYHPLLYEKNLVKKINMGDDESIYYHGRVTLPGLKSLKC
ncbi:hypothetical protein GDO86_010285 [Hymenochirus boettgeri]|uniref:Beta-galactoside alpha-2,6-sialyltransferase 1 n=1 Tax=Hymenochirus boettgeri TaxID=247094 RepID=A0A8T2JSS9_9PIPI|nr:hypothetical protein GDO86_010285 [Hymenochirus boettgeri]